MTTDSLRSKATRVVMAGILGGLLFGPLVTAEGYLTTWESVTTWLPLYVVGALVVTAWMFFQVYQGTATEREQVEEVR